MSVVLPINPDPRFRLSTAVGGETSYSVPFPFQDNRDIALVRYGVDGSAVPQVEGVHYTLTGAGSPAGGTATLSSPMVAGEKMLRVGRAIVDRVTSIVRKGRFSSDALDSDLDRWIIIAQELARESARGWKAPYGQAGGTIVAGAAGTVPKFDDAGNLVEGPDGGEIEHAQDYAEQAQSAQQLAQSAADRAENAASSFVEVRTNFKTVPMLQADETMGYASGAPVIVGAGDIVTAQGFRFEVAPSDGTDQHVMTQGGVKLYEAGPVFTLIDRLARMTGSSTISFSSLTQEGRAGTFVWKSDDLSAEVITDPQQGLYVAPASDPTGASGAWVRQWSGAANIMWWGASPDNPDNTAAYSAAIAALDDGTEIMWPFIEGATWAGHFLVPDGRSFRLDFCNNLATETADEPLVRMRGSASILTTLSANASYGDRTISVTSATGLGAGGDDLIMLEDGKVRPSTTTRINQELLRTTGVSGNTVTVEDMVRSMQDNGTRNVYLLTPVLRPVIRNLRARINDPYVPVTHETGHSNNVVEVYYSRDALVENVHVENHYGDPISIRYAYGWIMRDCVVSDPSNVSIGGYGPGTYVGRKGRNERVGTIGCRNVSDLHACYDVDLIDIWCRRGKQPQQEGVNLAHNRHGGNIRLVGARLYDVVGSAVNWVNNGPENPQDFVARDVTIRDVTGTQHLNADTPGGAFIRCQNSFANWLVDKVSMGAFLNNAAPDLANSIVRFDGVCYGASTFSELFAPRAGAAVFGYLGGAPAVTSGINLVRVINAHVGTAVNVVRVDGCKHLATQNLTAGALTSTVKAVATRHGVANVTNDTLGLSSVLP